MRRAPNGKADYKLLREMAADLLGRHRGVHDVADHFVIDGSNLATEGRTEPSLAQLKEAVAAFHAEHPGAVATVVVDASFEHRIDPSERAAFAKTEAANEVVSPPAGAVGRGDGFLLQIADRIGAARSSRTTRSRSSTPSTSGCSSRAGSSAASRCPASGGSSRCAGRCAGS